MAIDKRSGTHLHAEVIPVPIEEELKRSYLDYAMSVIVSRALPDVRDGLKPVHRRILYTMLEAGLDFNKPHRKSATVVGQVIYRYHPHGTDPIYEAMVRLAQPFSMEVMLIDGQGNFGSMDGDRAAAMRYTEARLSRASHYLLEDCDKDTVDFVPNYDETLTMPSVLPARFPNLLVNGANGIAVGMATNIPCHNLGEVIDACCLLIDQPDATLTDVMKVMPGPDFPTGGIIIGQRGIRDAFETGRGTFSIQARCQIEEIRKDRFAIIATEMPYQVNKALMIERIADLVNHKQLDGISDLRDESNREGVRVVIELKRDAVPDVVLNQLFTHSSLQVSFSVNAVVLDKGRPKQMGVMDVLHTFIDFRRQVVIRRTQFYLRKARKQAHNVVGLVVAISHIDEVIRLIKASQDQAEALRVLSERIWTIDGTIRHYLVLLGEKAFEEDENAGTGTSAEQKEKGDRYQFSEEQAKAILALRLQRLTGMEREKLFAELEGLCADIKGYLELLGSHTKIMALIKDELLEVKKLLGTPRRSEIRGGEMREMDVQDLIPLEDMVVTVSLRGYIKRVPLSVYRSQKRGGRGRNAMSTREEDAVSQVFVTDTHTTLIFFSSFGKAYAMPVYELPLEGATSRGKPLISFFPLVQGETLATLLPLPRNEDLSQYAIVFATSDGDVRKNALEDFLSLRASGKIAMKLSGETRLLSVALARDSQDIMLSTRKGKSIRFPVEDLRQFTGRTSSGVRGIRLGADDEVVSMSVVNGNTFSPVDRDVYLRQAAKLAALEGQGDDEELEKVDNCDDDVSEIGGAESETETETQNGDGAGEPHVLTEEQFQEMRDREQFLLTVSELGFGKRTSSYAYRCSGRGGQGVATMNLSGLTGGVVSVFPVNAKDEILLLTDRGQLLRCPVETIRIAGRCTRGVRVFRLEEGEKISSVALLTYVEEGAEEILEDLS